MFNLSEAGQLKSLEASADHAQNMISTTRLKAYVGHAIGMASTCPHDRWSTFDLVHA